MTPEPPPRIAVTGAAGLVGARLADDLAVDHDVVRVDRARADVLDLQALERAFAGCTAIVHLAAGVLRSGTWDEVSLGESSRSVVLREPSAPRR